MEADGSLLVALVILLLTTMLGLSAFFLRREIKRYDERRSRDREIRRLFYQRLKRCERRLDRIERIIHLPEMELNRSYDELSGEHEVLDTERVEDHDDSHDLGDIA